MLLKLTSPCDLVTTNAKRLLVRKEMQGFFGVVFNFFSAGQDISRCSVFLLKDPHVTYLAKSLQ